MSSPKRLLGSLLTNIPLVVLAPVVALLSLIPSEPLVRRMADEERFKTQTWAEAIECIASQSDEQLSALALQILESNTTIPLIFTDSLGNILGYKSIDPEAVARGSTYLVRRLTAFRSGYVPIETDLGTAGRQYLYYSDNNNLKRLLCFPYLQTGIFILYIIIPVLTIRSLLYWKQGRIWVELSKGTAHQLGTPISSLMAWAELLKSYDLPPEIIESIGRDVNRLELIAHRFQKVGSLPGLSPIEFNGLIAISVQHLSRCISRQIGILSESTAEELYCLITPDLMSWAVENIVKDGIDMMDGKDTITITTEAHDKNAYLEITDTGRGIIRATQRMIFKPGFTTKERGWGLGLSFARRIIRHYLRGRIYVERPEPQVGAIFRITLPLQQPSQPTYRSPSQ